MSGSVLRSLVGTTLTGLALQGCSPDFSGPGPDNSLPEQRGTDIGLVSSIAESNWSPSGDYLVFSTDGWQSGILYHVPSGTSQVLYQTADASTLLYDIQRSSDGEEFYTVVFHVIRRHSSTGTTVLTANGAGQSSPGRDDPLAGRMLLVSSTQPAAAFIAEPDQLFWARRGTEPRLIGIGCLGIIAFSPDETQVLCRVAGQASWGFRLFRTDGGESEPLALPPDVTGTARLFRWDGNGIKIGYRYGLELWLYDHHSGAKSLLLPATKFPEIERWGFSWTRDGTRLAYFTNRCGEATSFLSCAIQAVIYVLDSGGSPRRVGVHTASASYGDLAISPGGSTIAYIADHRLYLLSVP